MTVSLALETYLGLKCPALEKRGLVDDIGELSCDLFGTVMNQDIVEIKREINQLASLASANNSNSDRVSKVSQAEQASF